ncbi:hypothetical protein WJX84_008924, partial [Apatococcus fuscideae]
SNFLLGHGGIQDQLPAGFCAHGEWRTPSHLVEAWVPKQQAQEGVAAHTITSGWQSCGAASLRGQVSSLSSASAEQLRLNQAA